MTSAMISGGHSVNQKSDVKAHAVCCRSECTDKRAMCQKDDTVGIQLVPSYRPYKGLKILRLQFTDSLIALRNNVIWYGVEHERIQLEKIVVFHMIAFIYELSQHTILILWVK